MSPLVPAHLQSTEALIARAFPQGVCAQDYLPLLSVLSECLCHEHLAWIAERWGPQTVSSGLNDTLRAISETPHTSCVLTRLRAAGLQQWIDECE